MIATSIIFIISKILFVLTLPFRLLSDVVLPAGITNAINEASGSLSGINSIVPMDVLLDVLLAVIALEVGIFAFKSVNWLIRKIPGVN
jgi:hypothetical protein